MRDDRERLLDIREAIERVERYTTAGRATFDQSELVQNWVVHHLQVIGEACRSLSSELRDRHPEVPWSQIVGMRHIHVHNYFEIDTDLVHLLLHSSTSGRRRLTRRLGVPAAARTLLDK